MSNSRGSDYQPLHTDVLDSPAYHRLENPPDTPNQYISPSSRRDHDDDDEEEEGLHASESQELVGSFERNFGDHLRPQQLGRHDEQELDGHHEKPSNSKVAAAEWAIRIQAFFCAAMLGVSTHYTLHMTGPLKDVLKENMGITNTQFSLLQSSLTLFPTLIPLIGGLLVERYGTGPSSIVFTSIVILGQIIVILGCWAHSVKVMIVGYCLFGLGAAPITIIQETIWVRYFRKNGLALVLALGLTTGKLSGFLALTASVPLSTLQPFGFVTPFVVSLVISVIAWVMNIIFLMLLKKPKEGADAMTKITILLKAKRTHLGWREVGYTLEIATLNRIKTIVLVSNIVKHRYGLNDEQAAWEASVILAVPLIIYPFLGTFIDHAGKRAWLLLVTAVLLISTHLILLIPFSVIPIPPTIPMLLFALSLSLGTLSIVTSMPVLTRHVPTGLGLHRSIDNIGATLFGTISGMMQDFSDSVDGDEASQSESFFDRLYHHFFPSPLDEALQEREDLQLLGMFLAVAIILFIACTVFVWGDYHWTDGEGGKTGLVNGIYGGREISPLFTRRSRSNRRRRSHEVLEAMTLEPIFELADEPDAEEVSMADIGSNHHRFHSNQQEPALNNSHSSATSTHRTGPLGAGDRMYNQYGHDRQGQEHDRLREAFSSEEEGEDESQDERGEYRFGVRIESGEDEVPHHKKIQAHFWIIVWSVLLLASWAVFGVGVSR
ncbi:hypothetical protein EDD11_002284 [Mortierella claussenii]|nr:hypothetical protein EDD11_002284 [Mortierella claussenii]